MTADALATELEVSPRTIYRDLIELGAAGVPLYGERGKGGGYRLLDGYRTNLTGLTADEAGALLLAGAPGPVAELGLGSLLATTRLKLLAAVPPALREAALRAEGRFHLDPGGWAHNSPRNDRHLQTVARAVWNDRALQIRYRRADGRSVERVIDPVGLVHKTGVWYLVAVHEASSRVYRVDRLQHAREIGAAAIRPADFDLVAFWEQWEASYAATLPTFAAHVRLGPLAQRHRGDLGALAPRAVTEHGRTAEGWVEQTLLFDAPRVAVAALLALAPEVEVIAPDALRDELAAVAQQLIDRCRTPGSASPEHAGASEPGGSVETSPRVDLRPYLGRMVTVTVDRPLGSRHPLHSTMRYPVNYGFLAGTKAGDGEPIDAYVLGIEEPVKEALGRVIGLVLRDDDDEDKLVVASDGMRLPAEVIRAQIDFQEQFFVSQILTLEEHRG